MQTQAHAETIKEKKKLKVTQDAHHGEGAVAITHGGSKP